MNRWVLLNVLLIAVNLVIYAMHRNAISIAVVLVGTAAATALWRQP